jgi:glucan biosynthesis protein C
VGGRQLGGQDWLVNDVLRCLGVWLTMVGFLGMAQRFWSKRGRLWGYSCEAAYPFYILHQTVIVFVGWAVVRLGWGIPAKYALIMAGSLSITLLLYDQVVRRIEPLRFLFGMKRRRAAEPVAAPASQPATE